VTYYGNILQFSHFIVKKEFCLIYVTNFLPLTARKIDETGHFTKEVGIFVFHEQVTSQDRPHSLIVKLIGFCNTGYISNAWMIFRSEFLTTKRGTMLISICVGQHVSRYSSKLVDLNPLNFICADT
jgi:hypothetical protein